MKIALVVLVSVLVKTSSLYAGFSVGRISEGQFEYSDLNGWMTPRKAAEICKDDPQCGGLTYKGSMNLDREFEVYFFHIVINIEEDINAYKWIYYKADKNFTIFAGAFENEAGVKSRQFVNEKIDAISPEDKCLMDSECVAIVKTENVTTAMLIDFLDVDTLKISEEKTTFIKNFNANINTNIFATSSWDYTDTCCPEHPKVNTQRLMRTISDTIPRISCDIPVDEFVALYVEKREPVILVNCSQNWVAQKKWSREALLKQNGGKLMWKSDFEIKSGLFDEFKEHVTLPGNILLEILEKNGTIKVFDSLARHMHTDERRKGNRLDSDKMELFEDYSKPGPVPSDYYERAGLLTDYQWVIIGSKETGTGLHTDPEYTSAWNTVLTGHKWWVLMPPEVLPDPFLCDEECSCEDCGNGDINVHSWFTHVLPQLRKRKWYGKSVREFIQGPGETIYMPGNIAHAVMNIDDTLSITENSFLSDSLDDWVHGMMADKELLHGHSSRPRVADVFWKGMYYKLLDREGRKVVRAMRDQVENMINNNQDACDDTEEEVDTEEEQYESNDDDYETTYEEDLINHKEEG